MHLLAPVQWSAFKGQGLKMLGEASQAVASPICVDGAPLRHVLEGSPEAHPRKPCFSVCILRAREAATLLWKLRRTLATAVCFRTCTGSHPATWRCAFADVHTFKREATTTPSAKQTASLASAITAGDRAPFFQCLLPSVSFQHHQFKGNAAYTVFGV